MAFSVSTAENIPREFGENSLETFGENILLFGAFFGALFGDQLFASKSEKFVQNPFCKRAPLNNYGLVLFRAINSEKYQSVGKHF